MAYLKMMQRRASVCAGGPSRVMEGLPKGGRTVLWRLPAPEYGAVGRDFARILVNNDLDSTKYR